MFKFITRISAGGHSKVSKIIGEIGSFFNFLVNFASQ